VRDYAGNAAVAKTTANVPHPYPEGAAEKWIASHPIQFLEKKNVVFAIRSRDGALLGAINLGLSLDDRRGELGYWIGLPHWNQGICTQAVGRVIQYGFEDLGLNRIYARHLSINPASGRAMEKNGMKKEGVQREHFMKDGVFMDVVEYGILRAEYNTS
jgi:RimJ/RimL family protein N-acetyltransferase